MDNKILRIAGIQSVCLLCICLLIAGFLHSHEESTVQANSSDLETNSSNYTEKDEEYVVLIDPGHGGLDSGTLGYDEEHEEKSINLAVANLILQKLSKDSAIKVKLTRYGDQLLTPEERIERANAINPDIMISIHCNSADNKKAMGVEVLYQERAGEEENASRILAEKCLENVLAQTGQVNRGLLDGDSIYIIRNAKMPAVLVEIGFFSNRKEFKYLCKEENQEKIAEGIVTTIKQMKGMDDKNEKDSICNDESGKNERG